MEQITVQQTPAEIESGSGESSAEKVEMPTPEELEQELRTRALLEDKYEEDYMEDMEEQEGDSEIQKVLGMISQSKPVVIIPPEHDLALIEQKPDFIYLEDSAIGDRLSEWADQGVEALQEGDFIKAAKELSQAEQLVNAVHYSFKSIPPVFRSESIQVMLNLAILYYRVGFLEESYASFLNTSQMVAQHLTLLQKDKPLSIGQTMAVILQEQQYLKVLNQIDLQVCILLSELGKNPEALEYSRKAAEGNYYIFLTSLFHLLHSIYKLYPVPVQKQSSLKRPGTKQGYGTGQFIIKKGNVRPGVQQVEESKNRNGSGKRGLSNTSQPGNPVLLNSQKIETPLVKLSEEEEEKVRLLNYLLSIYQNTRKEIATLSPSSKTTYSTLISDLQTQIDSMASHLLSHSLPLSAPPDQSSLFHCLDTDHPIYESTILSVLQMKPHKVSFCSPDEIYSFNYLYDTVVMALSYYCNSTELRFIEEKQKMMESAPPLPKRICESELMLGVAMLVVYQYLRHDIPLVGQIISVYNRAYGLAQQQIYEEDEYEYSYTYLRVVRNGSKVSGFSPVIRFVKSHEALQESMVDSMIQATKPVQGMLRVDRTGKERAKERVVKPDLQERREKRLQRNFHLKDHKQKELKEISSQQLVLQQQNSLKKSDSRKDMEGAAKSASVSVTQPSASSLNVRNLTFAAKKQQTTKGVISNKTSLTKKVVSSNVYQLNKIYQTKEKEKKKKVAEQPMDIQINNYINIFFNNEKAQGNNNELNKLILPNVMRNNKIKSKIN